MPHGPFKQIRHRFGIQAHMSVLFTVLILLTGLTLAFSGYRMVSGMALSSARHLADSVGENVMNRSVYAVYLPVQTIVSALIDGEAIALSRTPEGRLRALPSFRAILRSQPLIDAIQIGYADGTYMLVRLLPTTEDRVFFEAPPESDLTLRSIDANAGRVEELFFDADLRLLKTDVGETSFDPRARPWYREASAADGMVLTRPFVFFFREQPGVTFAQKTDDGSAVVGAGVNLSRKSIALAEALPSTGSLLALFRSDGVLLSSSEGMLVYDAPDVPRIRKAEDLAPVLRLGLQKYREGWRGEGLLVVENGQEWLIGMQDFGVGGKLNGLLLLAMPKSEVLGEIEAFRSRLVFLAVVILLVSLPLIWLTARKISRPLQQLAGRVEHMRNFHFDKSGGRITSSIAEIRELAKGVNAMRVDIKKFLSITKAISAERDFPRLLERLLRETLTVTGADGGLIALRSQNGKRFREGCVYWRTTGPPFECIFFEGRELDPILPDDAVLLRDDAEPLRIERDDTRAGTRLLSPGFIHPATTHLDMLCVPLRDRAGEDLGILALFKVIGPRGSRFQAQQVSFIRALAGTAAIALENQSLLKGRQDLLDSFIQLLAGTIDAKSPYTGGHCQRVPLLFLMLLQAARNAAKGPFKDFHPSEDDLEEAILAAWLHDCGKVTTPEYVADKAVKLETIYNRIHEIRIRFEVLKRDAEIACLRAVNAGGDPNVEQEKLAAALRELDDDFAFVASCNSGAKAMDDESLARLRAISERTWVRTLDKRLGASRDEIKRMQASPPPVKEKLLMDEPEHVIPRGREDLPSPAYGFSVTPPEALYNRGELYNLSIRQGTLTEEERYKINEHINRTIIMLETLPWPAPLRRVPEIAGAHHEAMDGTGIPRGLRREEISLSARMLAIADIFEALTASDRPYKTGKPLSEALRIMDELKENNRIDPDLYELFLGADIPRHYAEQHLSKEQNDLPQTG